MKKIITNTLRITCALILRFIYRIQIKGSHHIPKSGAALIVANHVSFIDWLLVAGSIGRPVRFIMYYKFMKIPVISWILRLANVIPIAGIKEDPFVNAQAFTLIDQALTDGELVCIFPEGKITQNGQINEFKPGMDKILERQPVPVIPLTLNGMWGSFFSRKYGAACSKPFQRIYSRILVKIEPAIQQSNSKDLEIKFKRWTELT